MPAESQSLPAPASQPSPMLLAGPPGAPGPSEPPHVGLPPAVDLSGPADVPPPPDEGGDPFGEFEDPIEGEQTRIDTRHFIAEQPTHVFEGAAPGPTLEVERGRDAGRAFALQQGETTLGRSIDNDIILTDIAVSRRHMRLEWDGVSLRMYDLGSGNGVLVNGRRMREAMLAEGDVLEVGETSLVVRMPAAAVEAPGVRVAPPALGEPSTTDEQVSPGSLAPPPNVASAGLSPTSLVPPATSGVSGALRPADTTSSGVVVPRGWLFVAMIVGMALVALLGATVTALLLRGGGESSPTAMPIAHESALAEARAAAAARRWDEAQRAYERVLAHSPSDPVALREMAALQTAREHERALGEARAALARGQADLALRHVQRVSDDSPFAREAQELRSAARSQQVSEIARRGHAALEQGDLARAEQALAEARLVDSQHEEVVVLARGIETARAAPRAQTPGGGSTTSPPPRQGDSRPGSRTPPPAAAVASQPPSRGTSSRASAAAQTERVLQLYRSANFPAASRLARQLAESAPNEAQRELTALADRIDAFAPMHQRIQRGIADPAALARELTTAIAADQRISGGHFARQWQPRLVEAHLASANQALARNDAVRGCQSVQQALSADPRNARARALVQTCEQRARQMLAQAEGLERSDRNRAAAVYREVTRMLPASHELARHAYQRVNQLARSRHIDEDE